MAGRVRRRRGQVYMSPGTLYPQGRL